VEAIVTEEMAQFAGRETPEPWWNAESRRIVAWSSCSSWRDCWRFGHGRMDHPSMALLYLIVMCGRVACWIAAGCGT